MRYHNLIVLAVYWHVSIKALAIPLTSVVLAEAGERCGGNMINARNCTDGLECVGEVMNDAELAVANVGIFERIIKTVMSVMMVV